MKFNAGEKVVVHAPAGRRGGKDYSDMTFEGIIKCDHRQGPVVYLEAPAPALWVAIPASIVQPNPPTK